MDVRSCAAAPPNVWILTFEPCPSAGTAPVVVLLSGVDTSTRETDCQSCFRCRVESYSFRLFHIGRAMAAIFRASVC
jgi:hypothetical protein